MVYSEQVAISKFAGIDLPDSDVKDLIEYLHLYPDYDEKEVDAFVVELEKVQTKFEEIKKKNNLDATSQLTKEQAKKIVMDLYPNCPTETLVPMLDNFDRDKNDKIDMVEFKGFFFSLNSKKNQILKKFDEYDADKNGVLSKSEIYDYFTMETFADSFFINQMFNENDKDKDGQISKEEFITLCHKVVATM